jgi:ribonuclease HII
MQNKITLQVHNSFDFGQAYTALSRVTSIEGLWITKPLRRDSFRTNTKVLDYYKAASQAVQ